jgi:hypothetical protein
VPHTVDAVSVFMKAVKGQLLLYIETDEKAGGRAIRCKLPF